MPKRKNDASAGAALDLAKKRLTKAIERKVDEPACAKEWVWVQEEILARKIRRSPDRPAELTQQAAAEWEEVDEDK